MIFTIHHGDIIYSKVLFMMNYDKSEKLLQRIFVTEHNNQILTFERSRPYQRL